MILDAFGPDAGPLLVAGSLGGLCRGLVVARSVISKPPVTNQILVATGFDAATSIVIGAILSLFLHPVGEWILTSVPIINQIALEGQARENTAGFLTGFACIAIAGSLWDFFSGIALFQKKPPPPPPVASLAGTP